MSTEKDKGQISSVMLGAPGGLSVEILDRGATLRSIRVPMAGETVEVLLQYPRIED